MAFDGGSRRAGHGGAAAALAGGACSRMNPARSPVERGPGVRASWRIKGGGTPATATCGATATSDELVHSSGGGGG